MSSITTSMTLTHKREYQLIVTQGLDEGMEGSEDGHEELLL